jgi:hypothetical protein
MERDGQLYLGKRAYGRLGGFQSRSGRVVEQTIFLLFPTIENRFVSRPSCGLFTVPTELPRLHSFMMNFVLA